MTPDVAELLTDTGIAQSRAPAAAAANTSAALLWNIDIISSLHSSFGMQVNVSMGISRNFDSDQVDQKVRRNVMNH
jgi:hypothetical protein